MPNLSPGYPPLLSNLKAQGVIETAAFAIYLSDDSPSAMQSSISFGEWDLDKYAVSEFSFFDIAPTTGHWAVQLSAYSIGDTSYADDRDAVVDSGTSLIIVPNDVYANFKKMICGKNKCLKDYAPFLAVPCSKRHIDDFPDLVVTIGNRDFPIPPDAYILYDDSTSACIAMVHSISDNIWILGDVFMRKYYTLFDLDNLRIGLAEAVSSSAKATWLQSVVTMGLRMAVVAGLWMLMRAYQAPDAGLTEPLLGGG